jgi:hypothetical protein
MSEPPVYETIVQDSDWEEPEELAPRPRRRLLGAGGNPILLALLMVILVAGGFIGGVLVEKGQTSSTSSSGAAAGLASRFAALRGGTSASGGSGAGAGGLGAFAGAGAGGATAGQVAYIQGDTLYVTDTQGNTVKVMTSPGSIVTKTVKSNVKDIHPGETVVVTGSSGPNGSVSAESIRVGGGAGGGGLGSLFGGAGSSKSSSGSSGGGPALFGPGG